VGALDGSEERGPAREVGEVEADVVGLGQGVEVGEVEAEEIERLEGAEGRHDDDGELSCDGRRVPGKMCVVELVCEPASQAPRCRGRSAEAEVPIGQERASVCARDWRSALLLVLCPAAGAGAGAGVGAAAAAAAAAVGQAKHAGETAILRRDGRGRAPGCSSEGFAPRRCLNTQPTPYPRASVSTQQQSSRAAEQQSRTQLHARITSRPA
jgi:hypothetical protein